MPAASRTNEDGFYQVGGSDIATASPAIAIGEFTLTSGETIKVTQAPGKTGVTHAGPMGPLQIRHFLVGPGDPTIP